MNSARQDRPKLLYFADPMCSWCWGFSSSVHQLRERFSERLVLAMVMGGLRPGTTAVMQDPLKSELRQHWQQVAAVTGVDFDFAFFEREDFIYDTEPACRAVMTFSRLKPDSTLEYFTRLQRVFYTENTDITNPEVLQDEAAEFGVNPEVFSRLLDTAEVRESVLASFRRSREAGVRSFPTLVGVAGGRAERVCIGYKAQQPLFADVEKWLQSLD